MSSSNDRPLIVQADGTILLETRHRLYDQARQVLAVFAELEKSPEYIHTYRVTPVSLWNAAAGGLASHELLETLTGLSRYQLPASVRKDITEYMARYGRLQLVKGGDQLVLRSSDAALLAEICRHRTAGQYVVEHVGPREAVINPRYRGHFKQAVTRLGFPVQDLAGYIEGARLELALRDRSRSGRPFALRAYQQEAVDAFHSGGGLAGGSGVIVLPCGAGKTVVALGVMHRTRCHTLIICTHANAVTQWREELLDKTTLEPGQVGEYTGRRKQLCPVTLATYQILTHRRSRAGEFTHFGLFEKGEWGLIIYDEVHLLPAPVFRLTAELQARRRLGLTATLVREDGREVDVFSLIGPRRYAAPWKTMEHAGWIAPATCYELRVPCSPSLRAQYAEAEGQDRYRAVAENPDKLGVVEGLVRLHRPRGDRVLVIGQYLSQLGLIAGRLGAPLVTGETPAEERDRLYAAFRSGDTPVLVASRVANYSLDLPEASVAIQVSGVFGSRQEEAQRLGRVLRPKGDGRGAVFYTVVTVDSVDQDYAHQRQQFLTEQGYSYRVVDCSAGDLGGVLAEGGASE
ncbi:MAG: DNA repair helicase XPB [Bacillota bacterium]